MMDDMVPLAIVMAAIAFSTFASEDLTCIGTGILISQGKVGFFPGTMACFIGIVAGDLGLFLVGRTLAAGLVRRSFVSRFVPDDAVERSSRWLARRGPFVILASRFVPGTRVPTYLASGLLRTNFLRFLVYFCLAAAVWTPLLVGATLFFGERATRAVLSVGGNAVVVAAFAGGMVWATVRGVALLASFRRRRVLAARLHRIARWEYWPAWALYPPVVLYILWLGLRHRSPTLFTATNPAMPAGGFVGERKSDILAGLPAEWTAPTYLLRATDPLAVRRNLADEFMSRRTFPVVVKPNVGQRGEGVLIVREREHLDRILDSQPADLLLQEYVPGFEFGVFYVRLPKESRGRIFSITEKRFPSVVGDGVSPIERLILGDRKLLGMAAFLLARHRSILNRIPGVGERVQLVELGSHCRGAIFLDGEWVRTDALERRIDEISRRYAGFYFGRYDLRTPSIDDFQRGENFKIIELNGVTSESTNMYDPRYGFGDAYRVLFAQWKLAFEIGAQNRERGINPTPVREVIGLVREFLFGNR